MITNFKNFLKIFEDKNISADIDINSLNTIFNNISTAINTSIKDIDKLSTQTTIDTKEKLVKDQEYFYFKNGVIFKIHITDLTKNGNMKDYYVIADTENGINDKKILPYTKFKVYKSLTNIIKAFNNKIKGYNTDVEKTEKILTDLLNKKKKTTVKQTPEN